jgi:hypothetical protein
MRSAGYILLFIGFALTVATSFKFFTKEKVADIGGIEISRNKPVQLKWSPLLGVAIMGIGAVVLWKSNK